LTLYRTATKQLSDIVAEDASQPTLSVDGRQVAYITSSASNRNEMWVSDLGGEHRHKIATGSQDLETLSWSADDTKYLYADKNGASWKLFVVDADGSNAHQVPWPTGNFMGFAVWEP